MAGIRSKVSLLLGGLLLTGLGATSAGISPLPASEKPVVAEAGKNATRNRNPASQSESPENSQRTKKQVATIAVAGLLGIILIGLALLGMVVLWGRSLRRTPLRRGSSVSEVDPLWYLQGKNDEGLSAPYGEKTDSNQD